jgi:hypothetical protein
VGLERRRPVEDRREREREVERIVDAHRRERRTAVARLFGGRVELVLDRLLREVLDAEVLLVLRHQRESYVEQEPDRDDRDDRVA